MVGASLDRGPWHGIAQVTSKFRGAAVRMPFLVAKFGDHAGSQNFCIEQEVDMKRSVRGTLARSLAAMSLVLLYGLGMSWRSQLSRVPRRLRRAGAAAGAVAAVGARTARWRHPLWRAVPVWRLRRRLLLEPAPRALGLPLQLQPLPLLLVGRSLAQHGLRAEAPGRQIGAAGLASRFCFVSSLKLAVGEASRFHRGQATNRPTGAAGGRPPHAARSRPRSSPPR